MLRFLGVNEATLVLVEVHKGACNNHIFRKALSHKLLRAGYYWPTLMKDNIAFFKSVINAKDTLTFTMPL